MVSIVLSLFNGWFCYRWEPHQSAELMSTILASVTLDCIYCRCWLMQCQLVQMSFSMNWFFLVVPAKAAVCMTELVSISTLLVSTNVRYMKQFLVPWQYLKYKLGPKYYRCQLVWCQLVWMLVSTNLFFVLVLVKAALCNTVLLG